MLHIYLCTHCASKAWLNTNYIYGKMPVFLAMIIISPSTVATLLAILPSYLSITMHNYII